jgi:ATP-dependent DNA helicase RecG
MINTLELKKLLEAGASTRIEMISPTVANAQKIARALVALANTQGGVLIVPLMGQAQTQGKTKSAKSLSPTQLLDNALSAMLMSEPRLMTPLPYFVAKDANAQSFTPTDPTNVDIASLEAMVIEVPDGLPHAYSLDGRYLGRENAHNATLGARALKQLLLRRGETSWEAGTPNGAGKDDIDWERAEYYAQSVLHLGEPNVENVLLRRGCLVQRGKHLRPTYAGLLLFGKQPQRWVRGAELLAVRFNGKEMDDAFVRQTIVGTLPDQIRRAEAFFAENGSLRSKLAKTPGAGDWRREDEPMVPPPVLREAIVNAVGHRDYQLSGAQIHMLMFSDRVEIKSPGKLPGHVTLSNLLNERYSRNETLVQVLADMGFIERLGYGIDRMVRTMNERGYPPPQFEEGDGGFNVALFVKTLPDQLPPVGRANAQHQRIEQMMAFLNQHGKITNRDYQDLCPDVSAESLRRDFVELVERGVLMRIGDKRGTYYILK